MANLKLDRALPVQTKKTDTTAQVSTPVKSGKVQQAVKIHASTFAKGNTKQTGIEPGERANTPHLVAGSLGWDVSDVEPLKFLSGKDVPATLNVAHRALDGLATALAQVKNGGQGTAATEAGKFAIEIKNALAEFTAKNSLLQATDLSSVKMLVTALSDSVPKAEIAEQELLQARSEQLKGRGYVEAKREGLKEGWNERSIAKELAGKATTVPIFIEYFGEILTVQPGDALSIDRRSNEAVEAFQTQQTHRIADSMRTAARMIERRVEVTEAQFSPVRTNEQISAASAEYGSKHGYRPDGLPSVVGGAMQELANHQEIEQFAPHVLQLSLATIDPKDEPDADKRSDLALERAKHWVSKYGRNEIDLDAVWIAALTKHAAELARST